MDLFSFQDILKYSSTIVEYGTDRRQKKGVCEEDGILNTDA